MLRQASQLATGFPAGLRESCVAGQEPATLLHLLEIARPDEFAGIPLDGIKVGLETGIVWEPGELQIATSEGLKDVAATKFLVAVHYESRISELASGTHHTYSSSDGATVQLSSFEADIFDGVATFEFQSTDGGEPARRWSFRPKDQPEVDSDTDEQQVADDAGSDH